MDLLFLGGKEVGFRCLEYLADSATRLGIRRLGVVTSKPRRKGDERFDLRALANAKGCESFEAVPKRPIDVMVSVQYHAVLTCEELALARRERVNLHMAPLPEYRGANQFTFAILNGDSEFGTTLHRMEPKVDAGPVFAQRRFPIAADETVFSLMEKTVSHSVALFEDSIGDILAGRIEPAAQETLFPDRPRHFYRKADIAGMKRLSRDWPMEKLHRHVRAFDMPGFEPPYIEEEGRRIYLSTRWT